MWCTPYTASISSLSHTLFLCLCAYEQSVHSRIARSAPVEIVKVEERFQVKAITMGQSDNR